MKNKLQIIRISVVFILNLLPAYAIFGILTSDMPGEMGTSMVLLGCLFQIFIFSLCALLLYNILKRFIKTNTQFEIAYYALLLLFYCLPIVLIFIPFGFQIIITGLLILLVTIPSLLIIACLVTINLLVNKILTSYTIISFPKFWGKKRFEGYHEKCFFPLCIMNPLKTPKIRSIIKSYIIQKLPADKLSKETDTNDYHFYWWFFGRLTQYTRFKIKSYNKKQKCFLLQAADNKIYQCVVYIDKNEITRFVF